MYLRIPPLRIKITLEYNPQKSTMLVGRLGVWCLVRCLQICQALDAAFAKG